MRTRATAGLAAWEGAGFSGRSSTTAAAAATTANAAPARSQVRLDEGVSAGVAEARRARARWAPAPFGCDLRLEAADLAGSRLVSAAWNVASSSGYPSEPRGRLLPALLLAQRRAQSAPRFDRVRLLGHDPAQPHDRSSTCPSASARRAAASASAAGRRGSLRAANARGEGAQLVGQAAAVG